MPGFELFGQEEQTAVEDVFKRGGILFRYGFDKERRSVFKVAGFEREFAKYMDVRFAQAVSSGTAAVREDSINIRTNQSNLLRFPPQDIHGIRHKDAVRLPPSQIV